MLTWLDKQNGKYQRLEWATLLRLYEEDKQRFSCLDRIKHDHMVDLSIASHRVTCPCPNRSSVVSWLPRL